MTQFECIACLHQRMGRLRPMVCDKCGRSDTYTISEISASSRAIPASEVSLDDLQQILTLEESLDSALGGGFAIPSTVTAFGPAGVGKSRSALRWATHMGVTLLVSLEMPAKLSVLSAKSARSNLDNLHVIEHEDWLPEALRLKARVVVFDSFHYSQKQRVVPGSKVPRVCFELSEWAKQANGVVLMIAHQNKKGRVSGKTDVEHWPDYLFKFERHGRDEAKVVIGKSRYCPTGSAIVTI